jgi:opacity protein-like surface antigen
MKKFLFVFAAVALLISAVPQTSSAQWSLGASYEIRDKAPKSGFGVRIERAILEKAPLVDLGLRAHFSYFNDENNVDYNDGSVTYSYSQDITNYDYGIAAVGGVTVGPISPYVGLGLGSSNVDIDRNDLPSGSPFDPQADDNSIYWNGFVGAKVSIIPALKPFVEYRFEDISNYKNELRDVENSNGRLIFGLSLSF